MASRVPVFDDEVTADDDTKEDDDEKILAVDVAGQIANIRGGAQLLESFYCFNKDDKNKDFGFSDSPSVHIPEFPPELEFYREQNLQASIYIGSRKFIMLLYGPI